tara:strand:- start:351 stop:1442 length:1092 start_codon:yes stop_codon:yes gene_type:complete
MDSFVIVKKEKKKEYISIHDKEINLLTKYIESGKNVFLCGTSGCGKTFIINQVLDESNSIEIWDEPLQKKDIFMSTIKMSDMYSYIEDYDIDMYKYKSIIESVSEGENITKKPMIVTSKSIYFMDNFTTMIVTKKSPDEIMKLKPKHPNCSVAAHRCSGNIYNFFSYLEFPYEKDIFKTPKDIINDVLCSNDNIDIEDSLHEHGHVWSAIQENYIGAIDDNAEKITNAITTADVYDVELYKGDWDVMPFFTLNAIQIPKMYFTKKLTPENIRPGKFWTKFGNQKMRQQKIRNIQMQSSSRFNHQEFMLFRMYAQLGDVSKFKEYNLTPQDFDVMNHLAIQNKLKQREVTKIKKLIKEEITDST